MHGAMGASHFLWLRGCGATSFPLEEVGPTQVFEAASYGEQGVGAGFRPAASRLFESVADDLLAGAFHDAGSDRQSAHPIEVATHSVGVGFVVADAGRYGFGPAAVRLQNGDHLSDLPGVQLLSDPVHARRPLALVRRHVPHGGSGAIEGVEQVEDEGHFRSGEGLLADGPDPRRPVVGLRQGRRRDRNITVEIQKFCKMLSLKFGHGKSVGFGINHPFYRKGRHHDRDA